MFFGFNINAKRGRSDRAAKQVDGAKGGRESEKRDIKSRNEGIGNNRSCLDNSSSLASLLRLLFPPTAKHFYIYIFDVVRDGC